MLRLKGITKNYKVANGEIEVLKGLDINFRKNEFVSILGPSGCGKTTTLNIVGGLDKYTKGDLIISGKSTKDFTDREWDAYRNQRIGFIFQSYNLIPHQTVLGNVELALTIAGVSKEERVKRSLQALEKVGLKGEEYKRPNQLSGGQCQRVAIARALVNEPDILLADEPTGALDSKTSVQIMELIKEISKDKLVIMVTHNGEIAEQYSTRIVRLVDGEIVEDTNPFSEQDEIAETEQEKIIQEKTHKGEKKKKVKMSWWTAFKLSLRNLFTKRGRTILTSFAGSIGIIGIALILAVSQGMTSYINHVQQTTLSSYPLTLESQTVDLTSLMESFLDVGKGEVSHEKDAVYKEPIITELVNALANTQVNENDLKSFKTHLETQLQTEGSTFNKTITGVQYMYDMNLQIYTKHIDNKVIKSDTNELMADMMAKFLSGTAGGAGTGGITGSVPNSNAMLNMMPASGAGMWQEMLSGIDGSLINSLIKEQYDLIYGSWPNDYNEVVLIVNENNELDDLTLYAMGLLSEEDINKILDAAIQGKELEEDNKKWSYKEICDLEYKTVLPADCFVKIGNKFVDYREGSEAEKLSYLYSKGTTLKVKGIIRPNPDSESHMLTGSIAYTNLLTKYVIERAKDSEIVKAQLADPTVDVLTGKPFKATEGSLNEQQKAQEFRAYASNLNEKGKSELYLKIKCIIPQDVLAERLATELATYTTREQKDDKIATALAQQYGVSKDEVINTIKQMGDSEIDALLVPVVSMEVQAKYALEKRMEVLRTYPTDAQRAEALNQELPTYTDTQCASYYDNALDFASSTYEDNMKDFGYLDLASPSKINLYTSTFENKDIIVAGIDEYNSSVGEEKQIKYTDYMGLLMSSVTQIVNAVTYVLIAFVSISLIVSSIMIGVITLISVQERTKEIGVLRAIGASKRDVSNMFNAETIIIGLASGIFGILITYLLCIPINIILHSLTGIATLGAILPLPAAFILIGISALLTLFAGIIPSKSAARKDPVVALRTE